MTVDDSTARNGAATALPHLTVVTPPSVDADEALDLRSPTDVPTSLADLQTELSRLRARVRALESTTDVASPDGETSPPLAAPANVVQHAPAHPPEIPQDAPLAANDKTTQTSPAWRSKTSRVAGWQPARR